MKMARQKLWPLLFRDGGCSGIGLLIELNYFARRQIVRRKHRLRHCRDSDLRGVNFYQTI